MADGQDQDKSQKTEEPTHKRLEEAREKGEIAKSQEVGHWFMTAGITLVAVMFAGGLAGRLGHNLRPFLANPHLIATDPGSLRAMVGDLAGSVGLALAPVALVLVLAALASSLIQNRPGFSPDQIKPKFSKISLKSGLGRLFSSKSLVDFAKSLVKLVIVGAVAGALIWPRMAEIELWIGLAPVAILALIRDHALVMLGGVLAVVTVIAAADIAYQKYQHQQSLRMSKQDIKDEQKQAEGDPMVKQRLRSIRMDRARRRMMAAVPEATVVITNPTHFAVALVYEMADMAAPRCVAKGQDLVALRIRDLATEAGVPVVENPPLARALYGTVEIDREIPVEHYQAVAEVISYVMGLGARLDRRISRPAEEP